MVGRLVNRTLRWSHYWIWSQINGFIYLWVNIERSEDYNIKSKPCVTHLKLFTLSIRGIVYLPIFEDYNSLRFWTFHSHSSLKITNARKLNLVRNNSDVIVWRQFYDVTNFYYCNAWSRSGHRNSSS